MVTGIFDFLNLNEFDQKSKRFKNIQSHKIRMDTSVQKDLVIPLFWLVVRIHFSAYVKN